VKRQNSTRLPQGQGVPTVCTLKHQCYVYLLGDHAPLAVAVRRSKRQVAHAPCRAKKPKRAVRFTRSHCGVLCMRAREYEYVRVAGGPGPGARGRPVKDAGARAARGGREERETEGAPVRPEATCPSDPKPAGSSEIDVM